MQLRVFAILGLLLAMPALASANTLSLAGGVTNIDMLPGSSGNFNLVLSDVTTNYTDSNLRVLINGGVEDSPRIGSIFGVSATSIPVGNLAGSIWAQGGVGPTAGLDPVAAFNTNAFIPQQTAGLYAILTINVGTATPGVYAFDLSGSDLINGLNGDFEPIFVDLNAVSFTVTVVPEPSSIVMGLFAAAGLGAVVIRRRRKA
jgi:hypothetical protein